ncbi:TPA: N-acetyltransferase 5 [Trebouxia sp. C0004]
MPDLEITFDEVQEQNLEQLKILNRAIFPINYQDRIYQDILASGRVSQLAYHNGVLVGAIACRLEAHPGNTAKMYIVTLGVLAPYRGMRIGSRLLDRCLHEAKQDDNIKEAYLHVQTNNEEAIRFYRLFNFAVGEIVSKYYKKLDPPNAVVLRHMLVTES